MSQTYQEVPLPVTIGATKITAERVSGPPSKMFPALRDFADATTGNDAEWEIVIEFDQAGQRKVGKLGGYSSGSTLNFWARHSGSDESFNRGPWGIRLDSVIAFRVLSVRRRSDLIESK